MKLYKSPNNQVYAYESDGSQDSIIPADYVPITQAEADALIAEAQAAAFNALSDEQKKVICQVEAQQLLFDTDWSQAPDCPLVNKQEFADWRQIIRPYAINPQPSWDFPPKPIPIWE